MGFTHLVVLTGCPPGAQDADPQDWPEEWGGEEEQGEVVSKWVPSESHARGVSCEARSAVGQGGVGVKWTRVQQRATRVAGVCPSEDPPAGPATLKLSRWA